MNAKSILQATSELISPFLKDRGYLGSVRTGRFSKPVKNLEKRITLCVSRWSNGAYHVDHLCEYFIPAFANVHNRYLVNVTQKTHRLIPTISLYFSNLMPKDFDWSSVTVTAEYQIAHVATELEGILDAFSIPYLDRFDSSESIISSFTGSRDHWADQDPILRYELLMTNSILKHDRQSFDNWFNEALQFCGDRKDGRAVWLINIARSFQRDYFANDLQ